MKRKLLLLSLMILSGLLMYAIGRHNATKQELTTFRIYTNTGTKITFSDMLNELQNTDVCLMGEFHNEPIAHWLEIRLLKALQQKRPNSLVFGGEMWERDQQALSDEYLKEKIIDVETYKNSSKQWKNFSTDYQALLETCREHDIPFYCTNIPRRYAKLVAQQGDSILYKISKEAKQYLPPLPITFNFTERSYANFFKMLKMQGMHTMKKSSAENLIKAQAVKDATMAYWINKLRKDKQLFFHINGDFHSAFRSGINYYLKLYNPKLKTKVISVQYEDTEAALDFSKGDYNIIIVNDVTKSYQE